MTPSEIRAKLSFGLTTYDRAQMKRSKVYNPYALGMYLMRIDEIIEDVEAGADVRQAVVRGFTGSVLKAALKSLDLEKASNNELSGAGRMTYRKVTD